MAIQNTQPWQMAGWPGYVGAQPTSQIPSQPAPQPSGQTGFNWVLGEAAAKAWPVMPNSTALLMDREEQRFYLKTVDASGMPLPLRIFSFKEITSDEKVNSVDKRSDPRYVTKEEFEAFRQELLYGRLDARQKAKNGGPNHEPAV